MEGLKEELRYLNDLTLTRIKDANVIWLTSLGSIAGLIALSVNAKNWVFCYFSLFLLPAFVFSIAWQLDGIARIRTYIKIILQPELGGIWEDKWPQHPIFKTKKRLVLFSVSAVFCWMYILITIFLVYVSFTLWNRDNLEFIGIHSIPIFIILISLYDLLDSFSGKAFERYVAGWKDL